MPLDYSAKLGPLGRLRNDLALRVRRRIFDAFMRECQPRPDERVADFGVSGHRDHPVHYFFETLFPYRRNLTAVGREAEGADWLPQAFPGLTFLEADLRSIPVPDNYFAAGICNAVVEHAGTFEQQQALVKEVCRVCQRVLFTTPNKQFPVELHTFLPFAHWLPDATFRRVLRKLGHTEFANVDTLNPLDAHGFMSLFPPDRATRLLTKDPLLFRSNLVAASFGASTNANPY